MGSCEEDHKAMNSELMLENFNLKTQVIVDQISTYWKGGKGKL